jgi:hypothetical protein
MMVLTLSATITRAQDSGALVEALVKKGILTDQEGEEIRADLTKEYAMTSAGKLNLASHVTSLKLSGDVRLRSQYDNITLQTPAAGQKVTRQERERYRIRVRANAEYTFTENFSAGVSLETEQSRGDSGNANLTNNFAKYDIGISKAWAKWQTTPYLSLTVGKQTNPFYTTDLIWDADINPAGGSERLDFHKLADLGPVELSFVGGQFAYGYNNDNTFTGAANDADANGSSWLIANQLLATYKVNSSTSVTVAPGFMTWTTGAAGSSSVLPSAASTSTSTGGVTTTTTTTLSTNANEVSTNFVGFNRNLNILTAPGDVKFKLFNLPMSTYWDLGYNLTGAARRNTYVNAGVLANTKANREINDDLAFLVGYKIGANAAGLKVKGDWEVSADYRQIGITSIDPNITDSDFGFKRPNTQGFKLKASYNLTDFFTASIAYFDVWNLKSKLIGAADPIGTPTTQPNTAQTLQVDLAFKF